MRAIGRHHSEAFRAWVDVVELQAFGDTAANTATAEQFDESSASRLPAGLHVGPHVLGALLGHRPETVVRQLFEVTPTRWGMRAAGERGA